MLKFSGLDLYIINYLLSEEKKLVRKSVRQWVKQKILPIIEDYYQKSEFSKHLVAQMGKIGSLGANLPQEYGCAVTNNVLYSLTMQELERGDSGLRSFASVQDALVMYSIYIWGFKFQKRFWLSRLASGKMIGCFGLTEPDYGSNTGSIQTQAVDDGNAYVLNESKIRITNCSIADVAEVWAKLDSAVRGFLVEKETPGFITPEIRNKHSLRTLVTSELVFQDCRIPKENIFPGTTGLKNVLVCFNEELEYAKSRIQFDKLFQLVQNKLVYIATEITNGQFLALQLGCLKDNGQMQYWQVSIAKRNSIYHALEIAQMARDILASNDISLEYMRHICNLDSVKPYEGPHDIHTLIIREQSTRFSAFNR